MDLEKEFEKQYAELIKKGYHKALGETVSVFQRRVYRLKVLLEEIDAKGNDNENGYLDFVIVVKSNIIPAEIKMDKVIRGKTKGIVKLYPLKPEDFLTTDEENVPDTDIYILANIFRGMEYLNIKPADALSDIRRRGFHTLTIDEGIAVITQYPDFLVKNNCFSLLASRHTGDKRVPAIWINSKKHPNLGWCWEGNPHTWLGSAYATKRLGN